MFIPLVDTLRCTRAHEETWLVASIDSAEDRDILAGTLGCPACLAEYPIRGGIVHFADVTRAAFVAPSEEEATRLAAALDLTDPRMTAVLHGRWGAHAPLIRAISPAQLILMNPPEGIVSGDGISIVLSNAPPLAGSSMDAVAVDPSADDALAAALRSTLKGGRRMLGPASLAVPAFLEELARDDDVWVARLEPGAVTSAPVTPTLRRRTENR